MHSELFWLSIGIILGFLLLMFWRDYRSVSSHQDQSGTSPEDLEEDLWQRIGLYRDDPPPSGEGDNIQPSGLSGEPAPRKVQHELEG